MLFPLFLVLPDVQCHADVVQRSQGYVSSCRIIVNNKSPSSSATELSVTDRMKAEVRKYVLSYAIFRPESAVVLAVAIICAGLAGMGVQWMPGTWWMWLLFGAVGEGAIVFSTLKDQKFYRHVINKMFEEQFDLRKLDNADLRQKLLKALEYRHMIVEEIERREDAHDDKLMDAVRGMEDWIAQIYRLAQGLDVYQNDPIIARDLQSVPKELAEYQNQRGRNLSAALQDELAKTISMKQSQWDALSHLRDTMAKARLQLDNTLSAMGTVYMQAKVLGSKDVTSSRAQRLQADMLEQVRQLEDTAVAMDEIYRNNLSARN